VVAIVVGILVCCGGGNVAFLFFKGIIKLGRSSAQAPPQQATVTTSPVAWGDTGKPLGSVAVNA
jgi:hypothetical protein